MKARLNQRASKMSKAPLLLLLLVTLIGGHCLLCRAAQVAEQAQPTRPSTVAQTNGTKELTSTTTSRSLLPTLNQTDKAPEVEANKSDSSPEHLFPSSSSFFRPDALELLPPADCHLRNLDYCFAGLLGSAGSGRLLAETEPEFESRCDELRATANCLALFNQRCQSANIFALLSPSTQLKAGGQSFAQLLQPIKQVSLPTSVSEALQESQARVSLADLAQACEPSERKKPSQQLLRRRTFQLAKCLNPRLHLIRPCLEDLRTAVQVFYEPRGLLPLRPSCCALSRFRRCSVAALDRVCGLQASEQLIDSFGQRSAPVALLRSMERICATTSGDLHHSSAYCAEVLPPSGMRLPHRRGRKASKLARALDLISFAPNPSAAFSL